MFILLTSYGMLMVKWLERYQYIPLLHLNRRPVKIGATVQQVSAAMLLVLVNPAQPEVQMKHLK